MKKFKPTWLYLKQHNITGLKYFGKNVNDPETYSRSGVYWTQHLRVHGNNVSTIWKKLREARAKQADPRLGKKHSPDTIAKIKATRALQTNVRGIIRVQT